MHAWAGMAEPPDEPALRPGACCRARSAVLTLPQLRPAALPRPAARLAPFSMLASSSQQALRARRTFFWNWTFTRCGCTPSLCQ